jgi:hypothetical protein
MYRQLGNSLKGEAAALGNLGLTLGESRRFDEAIAAFQQVAQIYARIDDRHREAARPVFPSHACAFGRLWAASLSGSMCSFWRR